MFMRLSSCTENHCYHFNETYGSITLTLSMYHQKEFFGKKEKENDCPDAVYVSSEGILGKK